MATSIQEWTPDTCKCIIEETHDSAVANSVAFGRVLFKCPPHSTVLDADLYGVLMTDVDSEQHRKNLTETFILATVSLGVSEEVEQSDGNMVRVFKRGITYDWQFTGAGYSRMFEIRLAGAVLDAAARAAINNYATTTFGTGKIVLS